MYIVSEPNTLLSAKVGEEGKGKQVIQYRGDIEWNLIKTY